MVGDQRKEVLKNSWASSGVLYIFQLAAISGLRGMVWFLRVIVEESSGGYGGTRHRVASADE